MCYKLKKMRLEKGLTLNDVASKVGISKPFYYQIEAGTRRLSYSLAVKIADFFKMKPDEIFLEDFKKNGLNSKHESNK